MRTRVLFFLCVISVALSDLSPRYLESIERRSAASKQSRPDVPLWTKCAIWYQIFPERFCNGDSSNDPKKEDLRGAWPHEVADGWQVSRWSGDWYELQPWEKDGKGFYFHAQQRRYGGDLQGVISKLDYLQELGINAIYFNPLFESPSLHKYDATFYHHIDNNFGPDPEGDRQIWSEENHADPQAWKWTAADRLFLQLIAEAHRRNIKIVIDGVFNHVGLTFWAFEDVKRDQEKSHYKDWFIIKRWDNPTTVENEFDYDGWYGVKELPELREDDDGIVRAPRAHIHAVIKRWMDPNGDGNPDDGVDGWRLDVADMVSLNFWREFRLWVRSINPEAYLVGEVWWEDWQDGRMFNAAPWLQGDAFDAVMNYRWAQEAVRFFAGKRTKIPVSEFVLRLASLRNDYPDENNYVLMNLYDSHDTDRLGSRIVNADLPYDRNVGVNDNRSYNVRKPLADGLKTQKLMALFQMTYVGAPMIYYGTEAGMWGADDPDCRKPMLWRDVSYENERSHPFGLRRPDDRNIFNEDLFGWYAKLIRIRKTHVELQAGTFAPLVTDDAQDIFGFERRMQGNRVVVLLNNCDEPKMIRIPILSAERNMLVRDLLTGQRFSARQEALEVKVGGKSGVILPFEKE
ncbi:MAG: alpha-amylase [Ignavibacteria bacterium]|nr:alpha-amylase [Ignavibacteria bacterium]